MLSAAWVMNFSHAGVLTRAPTIQTLVAEERIVDSMDHARRLEGRIFEFHLGPRQCTL
jgi:hypothetical protein